MKAVKYLPVVPALILAAEASIAWNSPTGLVGFLLIAALLWWTAGEPLHWAVRSVYLAFGTVFAVFFFMGIVWGGSADAVVVLGLFAALCFSVCATRKATP